MSLSFSVVAGARRRRRELALLKSLGLTRRQMTGVVAWQTVVLLVVALAGGLPLGLAAGRWTWDRYAASLGVAPVPVFPAWGLSVGLVVLPAVGTALTAVPATIAAPTPTASALRVE